MRPSLQCTTPHIRKCWCRQMHIAEAVSHGAISVMNAMATGRGAALGISLWTKARVTLTDEAGSFKGRNLTEPDEDVGLIETTARKVFQRFRAHRRFGALVETQSTIPIAVGLKSSSASSNAVALASLKALNKKASALETINLGVDASLEAKVTLTGAFDDACACYFGGLIVTSNSQRQILKRYQPNARVRVMIHVPKSKRYSRDIDPNDLSAIRPLVPAVQREVMNGNYWLALTLNGLLYSTALGCDTSPARVALESGAIAAGLSGKGPATAAIVPNSKVETIIDSWSSYSGKIIETSLNHKTAHTLGVRN
jgi:shikimate kinase